MTGLGSGVTEVEFGISGPVRALAHAHCRQLAGLMSLEDAGLPWDTVKSPSPISYLYCIRFTVAFAHVHEVQ